MDGPRINEAIRAPKIRLIDENGNMIGVVSVREGLEMAVEAGLDLVEISPNVDPPVCKILDYGKYKFESQKKKAAERKKQKIVEIKEVQMRPMIEENDYQTKLRNIKRFIAEDDKVKITMRFKGRQMAHQEIGMEILKRVIDDMGEEAKVELPPKLEGRQMLMVLVPKV
ncbi:translation initiation factor IF-3 [Caedimonas varicaedens]|uniref:Translation initiation factor IF-3 n=1 Tax=Caedimonas varicaedens TaxID=1629334 RepID=A0A0K8MC07_9PROT|nr:translation initiation factor IF-3 [Caedimonas varicaedens]